MHARCLVERLPHWLVFRPAALRLKSFEYGGVQVAQVSVQGWRKTMEDVSLVQFGVSPRQVHSSEILRGTYSRFRQVVGSVGK